MLFSGIVNERVIFDTCHTHRSPTPIKCIRAIIVLETAPEVVYHSDTVGYFICLHSVLVHMYES